MKIKIVISIIANCLFCFAQAQTLFDSVHYGNKKQTKLSVNLNGRHSVIFNSSDEPLNFKNYSDKDSVISKILFIEKPLHVFYGNTLITTNGEERKIGNLLMLPGDSLFLNKNAEIVEYSNGFQNYVDSFINISAMCYPFGGENPAKILDSIGLREMLSEASNRYLENEKKISKLSLQPAYEQVLKNFNYLSKAREICAIPFDKVNRNERFLLDSMYENILKNVDTLSSINSPFLNIVYYNIIAYNAFKKGKYTTNFWNYFDNIDDNIMASSFYQPYLLKFIQNIYKNSPGELPLIAKDLKNTSKLLPFFDTLSCVVDILLITKTNYAVAKASLGKYANGRFSYMLDETDVFHRQHRNIKSLTTVNLLDFNKNKTTLQKVLASAKTNILVLDFWASWCIPCIADYPFMRKVENALKGGSIRFISISIDIDEDADKWINRSKQLKTFNNPFQYRLVDAKHSPVNPYFNLYSVPRYVVIDKEGNILDDNFDRPNEAGFQRKLQFYLRNYNK